MKPNTLAGPANSSTPEPAILPAECLARLPRSAEADPALRVGCRLSVLLAMGRYVNRRTGNARPSVARLAEDTGVHRATVQRTLRALEALGYILAVSGRKGGRQCTVEYRMMAGKGRTLGATVSEGEKGSTGAPKGPHLDTERAASEHEKGSTQDAARTREPVTTEPVLRGNPENSPPTNGGKTEPQQRVSQDSGGDGIEHVRQAWKRAVGAATRGDVERYLGEAIEEHGADTVAEAVALYGRRSTDKPGFRTLKTFAGALAYWVNEACEKQIVTDTPSGDFTPEFRAYSEGRPLPPRDTWHRHDYCTDDCGQTQKFHVWPDGRWEQLTGQDEGRIYAGKPVEGVPILREGRRLARVEWAKRNAPPEWAVELAGLTHKECPYWTAPELEPLEPMREQIGAEAFDAAAREYVAQAYPGLPSVWMFARLLAGRTLRKAAA